MLRLVLVFALGIFTFGSVKAQNQGLTTTTMNPSEVEPGGIVTACFTYVTTAMVDGSSIMFIQSQPTNGVPIDGSWSGTALSEFTPELDSFDPTVVVFRLTGSYTGSFPSIGGSLCYDIQVNNDVVVGDMVTVLHSLVPGFGGNSEQDDDATFIQVPVVAPMPVELLSFTAIKEGSTSVLTWRTASEINNDRFDIETSVDGSNFTKIDEVKGHGTTSSITDYKYVHNHPVKGLNYYRLKQIDFDGKSEFTPIRSVQFNNEATKGGLNVRYFPNPIEDQLSITTDTDISGARLVISDLHGRSILTRDYTSGMIVSLADYSSGVYLVRLIDHADAVLSTSRIILQ